VQRGRERAQGIQVLGIVLRTHGGVGAALERRAQAVHAVARGRDVVLRAHHGAQREPRRRGDQAHLSAVPAQRQMRRLHQFACVTGIGEHHRVGAQQRPSIAPHLPATAGLAQRHHARAGAQLDAGCCQQRGAHGWRMHPSAAWKDQPPEWQGHPCERGGFHPIRAAQQRMRPRQPFQRIVPVLFLRIERQLQQRRIGPGQAVARQQAAQQPQAVLIAGAHQLAEETVLPAQSSVEHALRIARRLRGDALATLEDDRFPAAPGQAGCHRAASQASADHHHASGYAARSRLSRSAIVARDHLALGPETGALAHHEACILQPASHRPGAGVRCDARTRGAEAADGPKQLRLP